MISQHLLVNIDLGPTLKCAPGQDSIEDSSIIKSYWVKSGVMNSEKMKVWFWAIWEEGGHFILVQPIWPMHQNKTFLDFLFWCIRKPWFHGQQRPGTLKVCLGIAPEWKFPGNLNSRALSRAIAPESKFPGSFYSGAKTKFRVQPAWTFFLL